MKFIRVGLTTDNSMSLMHDRVYVADTDGLSVAGFIVNRGELDNNTFGNPVFQHNFVNECLCEIKNGTLTVCGSNPNEANTFFLYNKIENNKSKLLSVVQITPKSGQIKVHYANNPSQTKVYGGQLILIAEDNKIRIILRCPLEDYVRSVMQAEMPANYHLEALKAQAVCARTYALHPRVDHRQDFCNICDSYLCCQCFTGTLTKKGSSCEIAASQTAGQILTYKDKPALALFSSCAGGHTENYEDCFSDWATNAFPPKPISYLRGVSENLSDENPYKTMDETALKRLWHSTHPDTIDAWSKNFRWSVDLSIEQLESHIHHNVCQLLADVNFSPFILPPSSAIFGEILSFETVKRGVGGTVINLIIETSKGKWQFNKELTIRSLFKNLQPGLKRLLSAKFFLDQARDSKQQLLYLSIRGLGSGHGVGMQQVGAQGLASTSKNYIEILQHYYTKITLQNI